MPKLPTPFLVDGQIYMVTDQGVASCVDAETGDRNWQSRFGGNYSALVKRFTFVPITRRIASSGLTPAKPDGNDPSSRNLSPHAYGRSRAAPYCFVLFGSNGQIEAK